MKINLKRILYFLLTVMLYQDSSAQEKQTFEESGWEQKDSMITTLFQGGAIQVVGVMIEEAYKEAKEKGDPNSEALAVFSLWQGIKLMTEQNYGDAEKYLDESIAIFKKLPGNSSGRYLDALLNMADLHAELANANQHLAALDQAQSVMESDTSADKSLYLSTLLQSMEAATDYGSFDKAQDYGRKALRHAQDAFTNQSDEYFQALVAVGKVYIAQGENRRASNLILQAYELAKKYLPENHLNRIYYGTNAVNVLKRNGRYSTAEVTFQEIIGFFDDYPDYKSQNIYPVILDDFGSFYEELGNLDRAYEHYDKANVLFALRIERTNPLYIKSQINVGNILRKQKKYTEAEGYYLDALQHSISSYGEKNWSEATLRDYLGSIYYDLEQYSKALEQRSRVKEIAEFVWGPNHQEFAYALLNLGKTYSKTGDAVSAKENLETAFTKLTQLFGENHFRVYDSAKELATFYEATDARAALEKYQVASKFAVYCQRHIIPLFGTEDRQDLLNDFQHLLSRFTAFTLKNQDQVPESIDHLHNAFINLKGSAHGPDLAVMSSYFVNPSLDLRRNYGTWNNLRQKIVNTQSLTIAEQKESDLEIGTLLAQLDQVQKEIHPAFKTVKYGQNNYQEIRSIKSLLGLDEALIDFNEVLQYDINTGSYHNNAFYLVFVIPGRSANTKLIQLELNNNVLETEQLNNQSAFYQQIWKPIESLVLDKNKLMICPDGFMHKVSFYTMPTGSGKMLIEQHRVNLINHVSKIGVAQKPVRLDKFLMMGAADNYEATKISDPENMPSLMLRIHPVDIAPGNIRNTNQISQLPSTMEELNAMTSLFTKKKKTVLIKNNKDASKSSLHKALQEGPWSVVQLSISAFAITPKDSVTSSLISNPHLHSGLAMAGAQSTWKNDSLPTQLMDDGLLTALEIYNLDLSETDLVVLPMVATGADALVHLKNALESAGAANVIYTLWPVNEKDRIAFFQLFYKNLLKSGSVDTAFYKTQSSLIKKSATQAWSGIVLVH